VLWLFQNGYVDKHRDTEEETTKDEPQPVKEVIRPVQTPIPQTVVAVPKPKAVSKSIRSDNNELTQKLLDYVRQKGQAKTGVLMGVLGCPRRTVIRNLNKLLEEGRLVREGSGPGAVYRLNDNPKVEKQN
jgi:predicted HTH transcriptional regulator